jgi:integrase
MACVWKHDSLNTPYWVARFTNHEGKRVNRSTKLTNRQKAQALADRWESAAKLAGRRELVQAAAVRVLDEMMVATIGEEMKRDSIGDYFLKWMNEPGKHGKRSDATLKAYTTQISGFLAHLGEERSKASITSLTAAEIEAWRNAELRSGKSAKTTNTAVATLRAALEKAVRQGVILHNPAKAVDPIELAGDEKMPFTREEVASLLKAAGDTDWRGMIAIGAFTGARLTDAAGMTWGGVDFDKGTLSFIPKKTQKTAPKPLVIAMHPQLAEILNALPAGIGKAPIFPTLHGRSSGSAGGLSNEFGALMKKTGILVARGSAKTGKGRVVNSKSFHSLRHFFVSDLAARDISSDIRKKMTGHSSDSAHARYTHLTLEHQRKALAKLPRIRMS